MSHEKPFRNSEFEEVSKKLYGGPTGENASPNQSAEQMKKTSPANNGSATGRQMLGHHDQIQSVGVETTALRGSASVDDQQRAGGITIGEALEATALMVEHMPVDYNDATAIQAVEVRATGRTNIVCGGVAVAA